METPLSRPALLGIALALGVAIVLIGNAASDIVLGEPLLGDGTLGSIDAIDVAILHLLLTSFPFVALALAGSRSSRLWWSGIAMSVGFWTYFVVQTWRDSLTGFAGGANIGLGLIMLASPFAILALLGLIALASRIRRPR
jgi:hypothetical protein